MTKRSRGRPPHPDVLTPAEWHVLDLVRHGLSRAQVAARLERRGIAVKYHLANIGDKLGVRGIRALRHWPGYPATSRLARPARTKEPNMASAAASETFTLGPIGQVSLSIRDVARAERFYGETLGLELESEGEHDLEFRCGQVTLDVFDPSSIGKEFAVSPAGIALRVPDVDAARAELEGKGVVFDGETVETSVCRQAWFKDPDGNALMLHRRFDA